MYKSDFRSDLGGFSRKPHLDLSYKKEELGSYLSREAEVRILHKDIKTTYHTILNTVQQETPLYNLDEVFRGIDTEQIPKPTRELLKQDIAQVYNNWYETRLIKHLREEERRKLIGWLVFTVVGDYSEILPQIDDYLTEEDITILNKAGERYWRKVAELHNMPRLPVDKYFFLQFDYKKISDSFRDEVPFKLRGKIWGMKNKEAHQETLKLLDKVIIWNLHEQEKGKKGFEADYFTIIAQFLALERTGWIRYFKPYKKIAAVFGIPYSTFRWKKALLDSL